MVGLKESVCGLTVADQDRFTVLSQLGKW